MKLKYAVNKRVMINLKKDQPIKEEFKMIMKLVRDRKIGIQF